MKLIIEDDEGKKTVIPVARDEITIGRNEANLVRLTEKNVSRTHARLVRDGEHLYIEDLNSFTGVRLNGEKVKGKARVVDGDLIQISEYDLVLQSGPDDKPAEREADADAEPTPVSEPRETAADRAAREAAEAHARKNADTGVIRLSDIGMQAAPDDEQERELPPGERPRLVGISGGYRGKELILDRTPIRLGRNEENHIEIDHPSISRRHCRLHLDGGTWKVLDAESRNGVRVNGEPYATVALRASDILEIGHLRFLFVPAGQSFTLPPEHGGKAAAAEAKAPSRAPLYAAAALAAVAVIVAVVLFARGRGDGEARFALRAADEAVAAHRYTEAVRHLDVARHAGSSAAELANYDAIRDEARNEELFHEMESAAASQDWERARKLLAALSGTHTYFGDKASEKTEAITAGYVNLHIAAAGLMKGKDNAGCTQEAKLALTANPQSADAQSLVEACRGAPAEASAPTARETPPPRETSAPRETSTPRETSPAPRRETAPAVAAASLAPAPPRPAPAPVSAGNADDAAKALLHEGAQKFIANPPDYQGAIADFQKALALKPGNALVAKLYRSLGVVHTRSGNLEEGAHYYRLYLPLCDNPQEKLALQKTLDDYDARRK